MSPSALNPRTEVIEVVCSMSLAEMPEDVKALEERIIEKVQESGRHFVPLCLALFSSAGCNNAESITRRCAGARSIS